MADKYTTLVTDISRPETARRSELLQALVKDGFVIQKQEAGLVIAVKPKEKFSIIAFLFLTIVSAGLLGVVYVLWYAFQKDEIKQFVILQA